MNWSLTSASRGLFVVHPELGKEMKELAGIVYEVSDLWVRKDWRRFQESSARRVYLQDFGLLYEVSRL